MVKHVSRWLPPIGILVILALAYGLTLAPGLSWANDGADGGDLITAASTGGVPHPTGYPLYLILAEVFQQLPWGELAFRTNLMSAVFASMASLVVYFIARALLVGSQYRTFSAFISAITFGLAPLVWSQAVITEVYAPQSFLTAWILCQAFSPGKGNAFVFFRGTVVGLALGNHLTSLFLVPILFWEEDSLRIRLVSRTAIKLAGLILGSLIYAVLPIRAMSQPPINWENPVTVDASFRLISGHIYQSNFSTEFVVERLRGWAGLLLEQFGWIGVAIGIYALLGGRKIILRALPLLWIFVAQSAFSLFYSSHDSYVYLIQPVLVFSIWIGLGIAGLLGSLSGFRGWVTTLLCLMFLAGVVFQAVKNAGGVDASADTRAEDFGRVMMRSLPQRSLVFTQDDPTTFAMWYFHFALKQRADITVIAEGLLPFEWYKQNLETTYPDLNVPDRATLSARDLSAHNPDLPVCFIAYKDDLNITCSP